MEYFEKNNIFCSEQHGFWRGRSRETQLLKFVKVVSLGLDLGTGMDVVVMDFAKAFDRVNQRLLTHKRSRYGIQNKRQQMDC